MIGSFWNLCRACPSMPIDKLHSEYRSTYTWHEYTGSNQEHTVVRRAPQPPSTNDTSAKLQSAKSTEDENNEGTSLEPPLPRRKKCPELAYRTHEFLSSANVVDGGGIDTLDSNIVADKVREVTKTLPTSQLSRAISRISTEYRLQFAWPRRQQLTNGDTVISGKNDTFIEQQQQQQEQQQQLQQQQQQQQQQQMPRKSLSMNALKQGSIMAAPAPVHKKRQVASIDHRRNGFQASELEPLVTIDGPLPDPDEHDELDAGDLKMAVNKNSQVVRINDQPLQENKWRKTQERPFSATEVIELRRELKRLAGEYKHRDWGGGIAKEDEATLWKRVSNNHALNALSLARSTTKEEKDKENTRKIDPTSILAETTALPAGRPSSVQARPIYAALPDEFKPDNDKALARARKDFLIRHHLDRTTGTGDGALLPSPTREKLEPVMLRRREEQNEVQPRSKSSPKNSPRNGRSQSVGPNAIERRSPKRHPQRPSSDVKDIKESKDKEKDKEKETREKNSDRERHPRPTFLATNAPPHRPAHHAKSISAFAYANNTNNTNVTSASAKAQSQSQSRSDNAPQIARLASGTPANRAPGPGSLHSIHHAAKQERVRGNHHPSKPPTPLRPNQAGQAMTAEPQLNGQHPHQLQQQTWFNDEPVVKSPPEPTRVKSPEQMIMRSPEPVNWTVPLDTGKTFTVTQNVREGEPPTRAHSEARSWTGIIGTSAPYSAPPELVGVSRQQQKLTEHKQQQQYSGYKSPESESISLGSFSGTNGHKEGEDSLGERDSPLTTIIKDELAHEMRCPDKPMFEFELKNNKDMLEMTTSMTPSAVAPQPPQDQLASDLLEKARNRFDKFWGSGKGSEQ
ncbi:PREDICTED: AF4/FMR2 family member 4 [Ceratosolen solmsi marchali]|uniref:Nuclear protein MDM1 n=1 Tax=Ceratosolen solmsi marchali TaxID=326594 RepID=A0AAJ6YS12_9HYME|nr:PREDICTED: AF4/FMR2 family member 4 [Ceratosolen solmsi marchali]